MIQINYAAIFLRSFSKKSPNLSFSSPTTEFKKKYESLYKVAPELGADTGYDALLALTTAMRKSQTLNISDIVVTLGQIHFNGASVELSFDSNRIAKRQLVQFAVVNGEIVENQRTKSVEK